MTTAPSSAKSCPECSTILRLTPIPPSDLGVCTKCRQLLWFSSDRQFVASAAYANGDSRMRLRITDFPPDVALNDDVIEQIPLSIARQNTVFPLSADEHLVVAVADPTDTDLTDKLRFILNCYLVVVGASASWIQQQIAEQYDSD